MDVAFAIAAVAAGVVAGTVVGWWVGRAVRGDRRGYWVLNAVVVVGCAGLNYAGLVLGHRLLALAAIGLMGGAITGLKYGYADSSAIWQLNPPAGRDAAIEPTKDAD